VLRPQHPGKGKVDNPGQHYHNHNHHRDKSSLLLLSESSQPAKPAWQGRFHVRFIIA
jgi:hypothetical protein